MVTDRQVLRLFERLENGDTLQRAAQRSGMDEKTARKYRKNWKLPSQHKTERTWRTREDPFESVKKWLEDKLAKESGLQSQTLLRALISDHPDKFSWRQLRTLQRWIKKWRALKGPSKEVYFPQVHTPGRLSQSDFTWMKDLGITINGQPFEHMLFHFIFTFSNWEDVSICHSESFESLSSGLQNAWVRAKGVALEHQVDRMTLAVNKEGHPERFTQAYQALVRHYGVVPRTINTGRANENGDIEKSHHLFKNEVRQELLMRGSSDFSSYAEYEQFLRNILKRRNAERKDKFALEQKALKALPAVRLPVYKQFTVRVTRFSTITVQHNTYSVYSRLIGEQVTVKVYADTLELWYAQGKVDSLPRLRGTNQHRINYVHIIDWLVRKPGAFENYRYLDDLFPSTYFRMAYDQLCEQDKTKASKEYLAILELAARESEERVNACLIKLIKQQSDSALQPISATLIKTRLADTATLQPHTHSELSHIPQVNLGEYDQLLAVNAG